jgi:DNA-binding MarR family transcriptional regulator
VRVSIIDESLEEIVREYPDVDPSSKSLVYAFFYLADRFAKIGEVSLSAFGLSWGEYVVLSTLRRKGPRASMSPKGLIENIGLSSGGISSILRRLESRGLIRRAPSSRDGRAIVVSITASGSKLADAAIPAVAADEQAFFGTFSAQKRKRLNDALRELIEHAAVQSGARQAFRPNRRPSS